MTIRSRVTKRGDPKESTWPSDYGEGERGVFVYSGNGLTPYEQERSAELPSVIQDSMEPLEHPVTREIIDSKSKFRRITKFHGYEEVGYDRDWETNTPRSPSP